MEINLALLEAKEKELVAQLEQLKSSAAMINGARQMLAHLKEEFLKVEKKIEGEFLDGLPKDAKVSVVEKPGD